MIAFNLRCGDNHDFEGWFASGDAFETERREKRLHCPVCGDTRIARMPSSPNIAASRDSGQAETAARLRARMRKLSQLVERHCENVGDRFAEEARRMHFDETPKRNIRGRATLDEARELAADGISFGLLPLPDRTEN